MVIGCEFVKWQEDEITVKLVGALLNTDRCITFCTIHACVWLLLENKKKRAYGYHPNLARRFGLWFDWMSWKCQWPKRYAVGLWKVSDYCVRFKPGMNRFMAWSTQSGTEVSVIIAIQTPQKAPLFGTRMQTRFWDFLFSHLPLYDRNKDWLILAEFHLVCEESQSALHTIEIRPELALFLLICGQLKYFGYNIVSIFCK